jgi:hypothetical protein
MLRPKQSGANLEKLGPLRAINPRERNVMSTSTWTGAISADWDDADRA